MNIINNKRYTEIFKKLVEVYNGVFSDKIVNQTHFKAIVGMPVKYQVDNRRNDKDKISRYKKIDIGAMSRLKAD